VYSGKQYLIWNNENDEITLDFHSPKTAFLRRSSTAGAGARPRFALQKLPNNDFPINSSLVKTALSKFRANLHASLERLEMDSSCRLGIITPDPMSTALGSAAANSVTSSFRFNPRFSSGTKFIVK
jgi:hypothetical protein